MTTFREIDHSGEKVLQLREHIDVAPVKELTPKDYLLVKAVSIPSAVWLVHIILEAIKHFR